MTKIDWTKVTSCVATKDGPVVNKDAVARVEVVGQPATALPDALPLADDIAFWSRQLTEHALFLHLLLEDPALKSEAFKIYENWQMFVAGPPPGTAAVLAPASVLMNPGGPLNDLIAFKDRVIERLKRGDWLGWALPSFVEHIRLEAVYFRKRLHSGTTAAEDLATWLQIVKDHADVGTKLVDPKANAYASQADALSAKLANLQTVCRVSMTHECLAELDAAFLAANAWVEGIPMGLNIVHPALKAHILRENTRALEVKRLIG